MKSESVLVKNTSLPHLPPEIITNILLKLPIRAIISCKCVCKSWFELVETPEFANLHLSKSVPSLIINRKENPRSNLCSLFEYADELDLERHELHYVPVANFDLKAIINPLPAYSISLVESVHGLLLLCIKQPTTHDSLHICNPITREYIHLPSVHLPHPDRSLIYRIEACTYGFGVSKTTHQYKVVIISYDRDEWVLSFGMGVPKSECRVYTLGTSSWRTVQPDSHYEYKWHSKSILLNGNLHWLVVESNSSSMISCFDLETELFHAFSPPSSLPVRTTVEGGVAVLADRLCLCDNTSRIEFVIWVMKEYGMQESWTKEIVICKLHGCTLGWYYVWPIKVFTDGDILLLRSGKRDFVYYSSKTKTTSYVDILGSQSALLDNARDHVSSFISLKRFAMENVAKF